MSTLKTIIRGESLSLGFIFPNGYNLARIEDIKVYVGSKLCDVTRNETIVTCRIKSDDTKNFGTINKVTFWLDDSSLGVQKLYVGDICVDGTNAIASNQSVNLGFDIVVNLTISETDISVDSVLYDVMKGDKGDAGEVEEAPIDDLQYARKNGGWEVVSGGGGGSAHIIYANEETTALTQKPKLRFKGVTASENATETIIEGLKGDKGDTGATGAQGIQGIQGLKGDKGDTGAQGIQGERGLQGEQGIQGIQGIQGERGLQGEQGLQGIQGIKGDTGATGAQGIQGVAGQNGTNGIDGKTAYQSAIDGGYVGSEAQFNNDLKEVPLKQTVFTGICQQQYLTENDVEIDTTNLLFKINTVKGGTAISASNPICFYTDGNGVATKHEKTTAQSVAFTDTTGVWYFYFNDTGTLIATQTAWTNFDTIAPLFRMYWNATLSGAAKCVIQSVEYHKNDISWADHAWKHNEGTKWISGFDITANTTTGTPNANGANTCIALSTGKCVDDNLFYTVTNNANPTLKFQQDLGSAASITAGGQFICSYNDAGGLLNKIAATRFPFVFNGTNNKPQYITSAGVRTDVTANYYFVYYVYSLQDPQIGEAIKIRSAGSEFANATLAAAHSWETLQAQSPTLRDNEIRVLYKLTYEYKTSYDAAIKYSALRSVDDLRKQKLSTSSLVGTTLAATSVTETNFGNAQSAFDALIFPMVTYPNLPANSSTVSIAPNSGAIFSTAFDNTSSNVTITPTAPTVITKMNETVLVLTIGSSLPTNLLIANGAITFQWMGKTQPTWTIGKKYSFVFFWESTTICQVFYEIKQ